MVAKRIVFDRGETPRGERECGAARATADWVLRGWMCCVRDNARHGRGEYVTRSAKSRSGETPYSSAEKHDEEYESVHADFNSSPVT